MLQNLGNYYANVFKKFGVIIPAILVVLATAVMVMLEITDTLSQLLHTSLAGFIIIACLAGIAFIAGVVVTVKQLASEETRACDLGLTVICLVALLTLITFIFNPGAGTFAVIKWGVTAIVLVVCLVLSVLRSKNVA